LKSTGPSSSVSTSEIIFESKATRRGKAKYDHHVVVWHGTITEEKDTATDTYHYINMSDAIVDVQLFSVTGYLFLKAGPVFISLLSMDVPEAKYPILIQSHKVYGSIMPVTDSDLTSLYAGFTTTESEIQSLQSLYGANHEVDFGEIEEVLEETTETVMREETMESIAGLESAGLEFDNDDLIDIFGVAGDSDEEQKATEVKNMPRFSMNFGSDSESEEEASSDEEYEASVSASTLYSSGTIAKPSVSVLGAIVSKKTIRDPNKEEKKKFSQHFKDGCFKVVYLPMRLKPPDVGWDRGYMIATEKDGETGFSGMMLGIDALGELNSLWMRAYLRCALESDKLLKQAVSGVCGF